MSSNKRSQELNDLLGKARKTSNNKPDDINHLEERAQAEIERLQLQNNCLAQQLSLQMIWSWIIGSILVFSTLCVWTVIFLLGCRVINFEGYPWLPHTILGTFFGELVGLGLVVAKYLFPTTKN